jgi:hypothetical protein
MEEVLYDMQLAKAVFDERREDFFTDEQKLKLIESVLKKHGITQAIMDSSLIWYAEHTEEMIRINDSVVARLQREQSLLDTQRALEKSLEEAAKRKKSSDSYIYLFPQESLYALAIDSIDSTEVNVMQSDTLSSKLFDVSIISAIRFTYANSLVTDSAIDQVEYDSISSALSHNILLKKISGYIRIHSAHNQFDIIDYSIRTGNDTISVWRKSNQEVATRSDTIQQQPEKTLIAKDTLKPARPNILRRKPEIRETRRRPRQ